MNPEADDQYRAASLPLGFQSPPHNIEAEQGLLGAIMINNEAFDRVGDYLQPHHFYEPVHSRIFHAITEIIRDGRVANHITMKTAFDADESLKELDGARYLAGLARAAETILNAEDYGRVIFELAQKRFLADICRDAMNAAMTTDWDVEACDWKTIRSRLLGDIEKINVDEPMDRSWSREQVLNMLGARLSESPPKVSTGFDCLDEGLDGGLRYGCVYGIVAPPKSGKTTTLTGIYEGVLRAGQKAHMFSLEQAVDELLLREVCGQYNVSFDWMEDPENRDRAMTLIMRFMNDPKNQRTMALGRYDHVPGIAIDQLLIRMAHSMIDHGTKVFIIDYFTKICGKPDRMSPPEFFESVAQKLTDFCRKNNVIIVIALQQNREGQALWSDGIKREASWVAVIRKFERFESGKNRAFIWFEVTDSRYGPGNDVGSEALPSMKIIKGPCIREVKRKKAA